MRLLILSILASLVLFPARAQSEPQNLQGNAQDRAAIAAAIQNYFDGIGGADAEQLQTAFDVDHATMVGLIKNEDGSRAMIKAPNMAAVVGNWASNKSPEGKGRDGEILDMTIVDGKIAMVMFRYKDEYFDVLSLLKIDDMWKIVSKTFYTR
ncbi:MAG: nuclear transport factor 2 family protein [Pseudomonadota bacterium]